MLWSKRDRGLHGSVASGHPDTGCERPATFKEMVDEYLENPGQVLGLLRAYRGSKVPEMAEESGIGEDRLAQYESGEQTPPFQDLPAVAKAYGADLRMLMDVFGYLQESVADASVGLAAQYSGPDLSDEDKVSVSRFVDYVLRSRKG